ncbi:ADP compounds hydrolase NudE [Halothiobacillus sp. DCM-1]|uniref:ADP compounds hydrolase NudE n=1 Tax=Halothiobacillus sp. DCM-1 TaxID=3112558 RepID=UPI003250A05B
MPYHAPPKICAVRSLASTRLFAVEAVDLLYANGVAVCFERLRGQGAGAVLVVPITAAGEVLLIREYACGTERYELGLPKGRIETGEAVLEAANRELQEEAGFAARRLTLLRSLTSAPAYSGQITQIVLAEDLYPARLPGDEPEPIEVVPRRFDALESLVFDEELTEARSIAALFLVRAYCQQRGAGYE